MCATTSGESRDMIKAGATNMQNETKQGPCDMPTVLSRLFIFFGAVLLCLLVVKDLALVGLGTIKLFEDELENFAVPFYGVAIDAVFDILHGQHMSACVSPDSNRDTARYGGKGKLT